MHLCSCSLVPSIADAKQSHIEVLCVQVALLASDKASTGKQVTVASGTLESTLEAVAAAHPARPLAITDATRGDLIVGLAAAHASAAGDTYGHSYLLTLYHPSQVVSEGNCTSYAYGPGPCV